MRNLAKGDSKTYVRMYYPDIVKVLSCSICLATHSNIESSTKPEAVLSQLQESRSLQEQDSLSSLIAHG